MQTGRSTATSAVSGEHRTTCGGRRRILVTVRRILHRLTPTVTGDATGSVMSLATAGPGARSST
eukprot:1434196-Heterocapsa_arctica.AAC.1